MTKISSLRDIVQELRNEYSKRAMDGWCHRNTVELCEKIYEQTDLTPLIRWGALAYTGTYETVEEAEKAGKTHFWVEIEIDGTLYVLDAYANSVGGSSVTHGDALIQSTLPDCYVRPENSLIKYEPGMIPDDFLAYEQYKEHRKNDDITFVDI